MGSFGSVQCPASLSTLSFLAKELSGKPDPENTSPHVLLEPSKCIEPLLTDSPDTQNPDLHITELHACRQQGNGVNLPLSPSHRQARGNGGMGTSLTVELV